MRILITTDTVGGVWDYTRTLVHGLAGHGHQVLLAVVGGLSGERRAQLPPGIDVRARPFRLEWMPDAAPDVDAASRWIRDLAEEWRPDAIHLNQMAYSAGPLPAPTVVVAHSDVLSWFSEARGEAAPPEWDAYAGWVRAGLRGADVVVAPSAYQSALLARHYGRPADRVIHNGVAPPAAPELPSDSLILLAAGRAWDAAKGMSVLDDALGLLGADAPEAHLLGALRGPRGEAFSPRWIIAHDAKPRSEVDARMARSAVFCAPSLYEPFGLAPLEAALRGCALVLSDIGSFRELWDGCAVFFAPGDADALAAALRSLLADPAERARLAGAARRRASERYTDERMAREYMELYEQLADPSSLSLPRQETSVCI